MEWAKWAKRAKHGLGGRPAAGDAGLPGCLSVTVTTHIMSIFIYNQQRVEASKSKQKQAQANRSLARSSRSLCSRRRKELAAAAPVKVLSGAQEIKKKNRELEAAEEPFSVLPIPNPDHASTHGHLGGPGQPAVASKKWLSKAKKALRLPLASLSPASTAAPLLLLLHRCYC